MSTPLLPLSLKEMDTVKFLHHYHTRDQLLGPTTQSTVLMARSKRGQKLGVVFSQRHLIKLGGFPAPSFLFCAVLETEKSEMKTSEFSLRFT